MGMRTAAKVDKLDLIRKHIPVVDPDDIERPVSAGQSTGGDEGASIRANDMNPLRSKARRVYQKLVHHSPMRKQDAWNWMSQILDIPVRRARIENLSPTQYMRVIKEGEAKIEEYKERGKWREQPRDNPWRYDD